MTTKEELLAMLDRVVALQRKVFAEGKTQKIEIEPENRTDIGMKNVTIVAHNDVQNKDDKYYFKFFTLYSFDSPEENEQRIKAMCDYLGIKE